jgi:hypothetical protein
MASSSRPFVSQTLSRLLSVYRRGQHGANSLFVKGRLALVWGVQIAVYPAYVAFQGIRTGYRRLLGQQYSWSGWRGGLTGTSGPSVPVTADTPIRALLSVIQPRRADGLTGLRPVSYHGAFLRQSHAGGVLTNGDWHLLPIKVPIRGIASDLTTRGLVLVTAGNTIYEGLTEDQRRRLEDAIALLLAEYAATLKQRQWRQCLQEPGLPLPQAGASQWTVARWFHRGLGWMQTSGLAAITNLFGEAEQRERMRVLARQRQRLQSPVRAEPSALAVPGAPAWLRPKAFVPADIGYPPSPVEDLAPKPDSPPTTMTAAGLGPPGLSPAATPAIAALDWPAEIDTVEARVSRVDYVDHWFAQLLRWIDQGLYWLEQGVRRGWRWWRRQH